MRIKHFHQVEDILCKFEKVSKDNQNDFAMTENKMISIIEHRDESQKDNVVKYIQQLYLAGPNDKYKNLLSIKQG